MSGASSSRVGIGKTVGFFEWLRNDSPSNISQLFLNATDTFSADVAEAQWQIKDSSGTLVRPGTCPTTKPLACSFGALNSTETVYLLVALKLPSNIADGRIETLSLNWNATGTPGGKNQSHGDNVTGTDTVIVTNNGDAAGDFNFNIDQPDLTISDDQKLSGQNRQATTASASGIQLGIAVNDSPSLASPPCDATLTAGFPSFFSCDQLSSLTSVVEVGNGKTFNNADGGPGIRVLILFSQMPNQLNTANHFVYHYWETQELIGSPPVQTTVAHAELVYISCTFNTGSNVPNNSTPCLVVGNKQVTVWLFHNGPMRT